jgi:hypothetical protein
MVSSMQNNNITAQVIGLALSLISAIGLVGIPTVLAADPDYTKLDSATAEENNGKIKLTVTTGGDIAKKPDDFIKSVLGFGYAWLDGNKGIVAAIHPDFDDSNQNPNAWHTHTVELKDNCVAVDDSQGGVIIKGNTVTLEISKEFAGNIDPSKAASFKLVKDDNCPSGAAVDVLDGPIDIS